MDVETLRREYTQGSLDLEDLKPNPFDQFTVWFEQACNAQLQDPNAMSVATVSAQGQPSLRTVLMKHYDQDGFVFLTNYESRKAREISENSNVALMFPWLALERQVIIAGTAAKISTSEALKYFLKRPTESQISAWASPQSRIVESRKVLQMMWDKMKQKYADGKVPLPSFWGGYRVAPKTVEFWQGRKNRLHDRFLYSRQSDNSWAVNRLGP
ncbi:MAG: pyridoxamine 5'-phosphate oxidase [Limisphaerales bacterium]